MDVKARLRGSFDLLLLFGRGISAFSGTRQDALRSFLIPVFLLPISMACSVLYPPRGMDATDYTTMDVIVFVLVQNILSYTGAILVMWMIGYIFDRRSTLWLFWEALNWTSLLQMAAVLPFYALAVTGWLPRDQTDKIFIAIGIYFYVVVACIANRALKLNWQLAGAVACFFGVVDQEVLSLLYKLWHIPYPWDY